MSLSRRRRTGNRPAVSPPGVTLVYLEAGQSNSNGWQNGPGATLFSHTFSSRVQAYYKNDQESTADDATFQTFALGTNTNREGSSFPDPSIWVAKNLEDAALNDIRVIQCGEGSTGFSSGSGPWGEGNRLANALENHFIKPGLSELQGQGREVWVLPFLFVQHEQDLQSVTHAPNYETQLQGLIDNVRSYVAIPDLPIILVKILINTTLGNSTTRDQIFRAQQNIASRDKNIEIINADEFSIASDTVHFLDEGYKQIAEAYWRLTRQLGARKWPGDNAVDFTTSVATENLLNNSVDVRVGTSEFATLYAGAYTDGTTNPGATAIKAGTGAVSSGSQGLGYTGSSALTLSSLSGETNYEVFTVVEDKAGNQSIGEFAILTPGSTTVEFLDTFTGTDNTALDDVSYTPDTDTSGQGWSVNASGNVVIKSNQAGRQTNADGYFYTTKNDWAGPVVEVRSDILVDAVTGLMIRYTSPSDRLGVFLKANDQPNTVRLFQGTNSVIETYAYTGAALTSGSTYSLLIQFNTSEIRVQFGGETFTTSNSTGSGNSVGGWLRNLTGRYDNFQVRSLGSFSI